MKHDALEHETWLDLSKAAEYLGVHFTTLRRWADAGAISYVRTPGGRRRFSVNALAQFVARITQDQTTALAMTNPLETRAIFNARETVRSLSSSHDWLGRLSDEQRLVMKGTGHRLMALLLQFNSRADGGEVFLDEGKRIAGEYSQICSKVGLSLEETVRVFLFFRRSILSAINETEHLGGNEDYEGHRLYHRTTDFFDELTLELIGSYLHTQKQIPE